jgi:hypothetical protein
MSFESAYRSFVDEQLKDREGESKRRLMKGSGHAEKLFLEKVWWPSFGNFHYLYPEFEVLDFKDGYRYLDFAYIRANFRACFEIDGYGSHWRDTDRRQFADHLYRQNHLIIDGWRVIRFSYDDVLEHPRRCQQMIQQLIGRWLGEVETKVELTYVEREIFRMAVKSMKPITPGEVGTHLGVCSRTAQKLLRQLLDKQVFSKVGESSRRIRAYQLNPVMINELV